MKIIDIYSKIYLRVEELKIYIIILAFTIIFLVITTLSLNKVKDEFASLARNYRISITTQLSNYITEWMNSRIRTVNSYALVTEDLFLDHSASNEKLYKFMSNLEKTNPMFDTFQLYLENDKLLVNVNNGVFNDANVFKRISNFSWFKDTKNNKITTVRVKNMHEVLHEKTINICSPLLAQNNKFKGVLCGVIKADTILKYVKGIDKNIVSQLFLIDDHNNIITSYNNQNNLSSYLKHLNNNAVSSEFIKDGVTYTIIKTTTTAGWSVGIGINETNIISKSLNVVAKTTIQIFILFIAIIVVANLLHSYLYSKIKKSKKEYEFIIAHQLKMAETGQLIGVISHQLKQPLNSTKLMISSILQLKQDGCITSDEEIDNLNLCLKSIEYLNETIENFKNFYKFDTTQVEFSIKKAVMSLINILHIEFARNNVSIILSDFEDIIIKNSQNFFLQILLVLMQNAKEALITCYPNEFKKRKVFIEAKSDENNAYIRVKDYAGGVSQDLSKKLFLNFKISQKDGGSGIGLYFSKKIAQEKLGGDLKLINRENPTIFELKVKK